VAFLFLSLFFKIMNFPTDWSAPETKKRKTSGQGRGSKRAHESSDPGAPATCEYECFGKSLKEQIQNKLHSQSQGGGFEELDINSIINTVPYKDIIRDVFHNSSHRTIEVPIVTRAYEESFMREPYNFNENQCVNGDLCECMFIDKRKQFIGVEFLLPHESKEDVPRPCVLCCRQMTQKFYFDIIYDGKTFNFPIQRYGNIFNQENEYATEVMLSCPSNGPLHIFPCPVMSHQRNRYSVIYKNGIRFLQQSNVSVSDYIQVC